MEKSLAIGAIIEDSCISAGLVNLETRKIVDETLRQSRINPKGSSKEIISSWVNVLKEVARFNTNGTLQIGMGIPGACDYESGVFKANDMDRYGSLYNKNIKELVAAELSISPSSIRLLNDSVCFLQGEVFGGAVRYHKKSIGITLGMGLGSAIFSNNQVSDANLWRMPFKGKIAEELISIRWIVKRFTELSGIKATTILEMKSHDPNPLIQKVFDEFAQNLADFFIEIIERENPEAIVIGGHMQASNRLFFEQVTSMVKAHGINIPIVRTLFGEKATVVGTAGYLV
jgi:glucokinase